MKNLVTVIIASYNHAPYIEESIESVLGQTYPHVELLVIDDGSTDDSVQRIAKLQAAHGFDFRTQRNIGLTRTLNEAIARARGEFIAPFGSDDIMLPDRLALQIAHIQDKPEVGICAGNIQLMNSDGSAFIAKRPSQAEFNRLDFEDVFLEKKPCAPAPTMLIRRKAFEEVGGFNPEIRLEDLYIQLKITNAGYFIDTLGADLARYRIHTTNSHKNIRFMTESILRIYEDYKAHPAYETVKYKFINSMLVKSSRRDRKLAMELLRQLPLRAWNRRTLASLLRYPFAPSGT